MLGPWRRLTEEVARWQDAGRTVEFWWRDDDAARRDPALDRLLALATRSTVPVALAVVPASADLELLAQLGGRVSVLQHGTDHVNRAASGAKKTEFPSAEPRDAALARLETGRARLRAGAGDRFIPVLAPPWNRIASALIVDLPAAGYLGLTCFGARENFEPVRGLRQVNTHIDIVAWKGDRGFVGEGAAIEAALRHLASRRSGSADTREATGWLTHHQVHDWAAWDFLERLFDTTCAIQGVAWRRAEDLFQVS